MLLEPLFPRALSGVPSVPTPLTNAESVGFALRQPVQRQLSPPETAVLPDVARLGGTSSLAEET